MVAAVVSAGAGQEDRLLISQSNKMRLRPGERIVHVPHEFDCAAVCPRWPATSRRVFLISLARARLRWRQRPVHYGLALARKARIKAGFYECARGRVQQKRHMCLVSADDFYAGKKKALLFPLVAPNYFQQNVGKRLAPPRIPLKHGILKNQQETLMKLRALGFAGIAVAMTAIPAIAHHSFAMFDAEKTKVLDGTIKEFQWTNPHSWILMTVNNDQGQAEQWAIEMGGPAGLARQGWVPKTLTPGMKVKTVIHPLRDGNNGGQFMAITLPDGKVMGNPNAAPSTNAGGGPANQ
jgi:Family of unknown function (DUF6152)